jgi:hypothetical protein
MSLSDPTNLQRKYSLDGYDVEYRCLMELCQGGPEVGYLFINGNHIGVDTRFGGPLIHHAGAIYIPVFTKSFFSSGFTLARIELASGKVSMIGKRRGLIYLDRIESGIVYYYTDTEKTHLETLSLEHG